MPAGERSTVGDPPADPRRRQFLWCFASLFFLIVVWSFSSPPMSAPDEVMHTRWAHAVVAGNWSSTALESPIGTVARIETTGNLASDPPVCYAFDSAVSARCAPALGDDESLVSSRTSFASYPPLYYAAVGPPLLIRSDEVGFRAARLLSSAIAAALLAWAFVTIGTGRGPMTHVGYSLAVTPMVVYLAGIINTSGLEISAAVLTWCAAISLADGPTRRTDLAAISAGAVVLTLSRPASLLLTGFILAVTVVLASGPRRRELRLDPRVRRAGLLIAATGLGAAAWVVGHDTSSALLGVGEPDMSTFDALRRSFGESTTRVVHMVGNFGWLDAPVPTATLWIWLAATIVLVTLAMASTTRRRDQLAIMATATAAFLLNPVIDLRYHADVGFIGQGRYALPLAVGVPLLAGRALDRVLPPSSSRPVAVLVTGATSAAIAMAHWQLLRRFVHGLTTTSPLRPWGESGWQPPVHGLFLVVLSITASTTWWLLQRRAIGRSG